MIEFQKLKWIIAAHSGKKWYCKKGKYLCEDPRNVKAHMYKHGDKIRYKCTKCGHGFNYY